MEISIRYVRVYFVHKKGKQSIFRENDFVKILAEKGLSAFYNFERGQHPKNLNHVTNINRLQNLRAHRKTEPS